MSEVEYTWTIEPEELDYVGNCGDDEDDRRQEEWVRSQLASGNDAAWCIFVVKAERDGVVGYASLGGCSYPSTKALLDDELAELKEEALENLIENEANRASHIDVRPLLAFIKNNAVELNGKLFVEVDALFQEFRRLGVTTVPNAIHTYHRNKE